MLDINQNRLARPAKADIFQCQDHILTLNLIRNQKNGQY